MRLASLNCGEKKVLVEIYLSGERYKAPASWYCDSSQLSLSDEREVVMVDFVTAIELLKAHHCIERLGSNVPTGQFFLKSMNGKQYLFQRVYLAVIDELVESPAIFEWDDIIATDWQVAGTSSILH
jgi:hypothetical protein